MSDSPHKEVAGCLLLVVTYLLGVLTAIGVFMIRHFWAGI